jgi:DNA uptake protein ComE-like DNA-binding protein
MFVIALIAGMATLTVAAGQSPVVDPPPATPPYPVECRLDPNTAPCWQLDRLPDVGPGLARRIAAAQQPPGAAAPPFLSPHDLLRVQGIGPALIESLAPSLRFPSCTPPVGR